MIGFGLGVLRLSPDALWATTPREIAAAMRARAAPTADPPRRADLAALMRAHPDGR